MFCGEVCKDNNHLKNHVLSHYYQDFYVYLPDKKPFECPHCKKPNRDRITLIRHYAFMHNKFSRVTGITIKEILNFSKEINDYKAKADGSVDLTNSNIPAERRESIKFQANHGAEKMEEHDKAKDLKMELMQRKMQLRQLKMELRRQELHMKIIPGDGNCQFRALADQMDGHQNKHKQYRAEVVDFMRQNRQDFAPFMEDDETFDDYTARMSRDGSWAGHQELIAFSRLYNVNIVVHQVNQRMTTIGSPDARQLHISLHNNHYNSVERCGDTGHSPASVQLPLETEDQSQIPNSREFSKQSSHPGRVNGHQIAYYKKPKFFLLPCIPGCDRVYEEHKKENLKTHILSHFMKEFRAVEELPKYPPFSCPRCGDTLSCMFMVIRHYAWRCNMFFSVSKLPPERYPYLGRVNRRPEFIRQYIRRHSGARRRRNDGPPVYIYLSHHKAKLIREKYKIRSFSKTLYPSPKTIELGPRNRRNFKALKRKYTYEKLAVLKARKILGKYSKRMKREMKASNKFFISNSKERMIYQISPEAHEHNDNVVNAGNNCRERSQHLDIPHPPSKCIKENNGNQSSISDSGVKDFMKMAWEDFEAVKEEKVVPNLEPNLESIENIMDTFITNQEHRDEDYTLEVNTSEFYFHDGEKSSEIACFAEAMDDDDEDQHHNFAEDGGESRRRIEKSDNYSDTHENLTEREEGSSAFIHVAPSDAIANGTPTPDPIPEEMVNIRDERENDDNYVMMEKRRIIEMSDDDAETLPGTETNEENDLNSSLVQLTLRHEYDKGTNIVRCYLCHQSYVKVWDIQHHLQHFHKALAWSQQRLFPGNPIFDSSSSTPIDVKVKKEVLYCRICVDSNCRKYFRLRHNRQTIEWHCKKFHKIYNHLFYQELHTKLNRLKNHPKVVGDLYEINPLLELILNPADQIPETNILHTQSNLCSLSCRLIRIGNYTVVPKDKITITDKGVQIKVPGIINPSEVVTLNIPMKEVYKVLAHFGKQMPLLFLYISPAACQKTRKMLKMTNSQSFYLDVQSADETQKRITILPEKLNEENKAILKQHFSSILQDLESKDANEILVRSSPKDIQRIKEKMPGAQAAVADRRPGGVEQGAAGPQAVVKFCQYPPDMAGNVSVTNEDYNCLEAEQFLNDVIIDFYLKYLQHGKFSNIKEVMDRTHIFTTYFYKRLTTRPQNVKVNIKYLHQNSIYFVILICNLS